MFYRTILTVALLFGWLPVAQAQLPAVVAARLASANIPEDALGSVVIRLSDGATLVSHQPDRSLQPASVMKVVSTVVGLNKLGPMFRGRTTLESGGQIIDSTLEGDLVLRGGADADMNAEALGSMLQTLRHSGIRTIRGDLIVDRTLYRPARLDLGHAPFDEAPEFRYNVIPDALTLNMNLIKLALRSDAHTLQVDMLPALDGVSVTHDMTLDAAPCRNWDRGWLPPTLDRRGGKLRVVLHGSFPRDCAQGTELNLLDRADYTERLFRATWKQLGGTLRGRVREGAAASGLRVLAEHRSRPLAEILRDINKSSDNPFARMLFLNLGTYAVDSAVAGNVSLLAPEPLDTRPRAEREIRAWLRQNGIDDSGMVLDNGSGLSRSERLTAAQLAALLALGYHSIWAPELMASLPLSGMDGTMRSRLKDSPAAGRARIKTGGLNNVASVAGFVLDARGRQCVVVGIINADRLKGADARAALDSLIDWVARSGE